MMRVRATQEFTDLKEDKTRNPNEEFNVSQERYQKLWGMGLVEKVDPPKKQGKEEKKEKNEAAD